MRNKFFLMGILVIVLVLGMTYIACDSDGDSGGHTHSYSSWTFQATTAQGRDLYTRTCTSCGYMDSQYR